MVILLGWAPKLRIVYIGLRAAGATAADSRLLEGGLSVSEWIQWHPASICTLI